MKSPFRSVILSGCYGALGLVFLFLSGCKQGLEGPEELVDLAPAFSMGGELESSSPWWEHFEDDALSALIELSLENSPDLQVFYERVVAAQAQARRERSGLFPSLSARGSFNARDSDLGNSDFFDSGLSASYEVDLFGRVRSGVDTADFRALASAQEYQSAVLSLSGELASTWYRLIGEQLLLEEIEAQIDANDALLESLLNRFRNSEANSVDVLRQERLLESTREQAILSRREIQLLQNQLLILSGQSLPSELELPSASLPDLGPMPAPGLPAELLLRRPDLRSAYLRLQATDAELAGAIRARFPRLNLSASLLTTSQDPSSYAEDWTRSILGELVGPIIDGGSPWPRRWLYL